MKMDVLEGAVINTYVPTRVNKLDSDHVVILECSRVVYSTKSAILRIMSKVFSQFINSILVNKVIYLLISSPLIKKQINLRS